MSQRSSPPGGMGVSSSRVPAAASHTVTNARRRLGDIVVEAGLVSRAQVEATLARQRTDRRRLGSLLVEAGYLSPAQLSQTLSHQLCLPWVSLANVPVDPELLEMVPEELARSHHVLPVYMKLDFDRGDVLYVATDDPTQDDALAACSAHVGLPVRAVVAAPDDLESALVRHYGRPSGGAGKASGSAQPASRGAETRSAPNAEAPAAMGAAMVALARRVPTIPTRPPVVAEEADPEELELIELVSDQPPPAALRRSVVLVVSPPRGLLRECRLAASPLGVLVATADLATLRSRVEEHAPLAIVVTDELYALDRVGFSTLSLESGSPLVIWSDELDAEYLEPVFATALRRVGAGVRPPGA